MFSMKQKIPSHFEDKRIGTKLRLTQFQHNKNTHKIFSKVCKTQWRHQALEAQLLPWLQPCLPPTRSLVYVLSCNELM